jgi:molecular chaperone DnaK
VAKRALIVANSEYDDTNFAPLPGARADAAALSAVLGDPDIGEFEVEALVDAGQRPVMRALEAFFKRAGPDDLLLLHLSLHGWKDLRNRLYFVVRDTEREYPDATAISAGFVNDRMTHSRSRQIVVLLDCCYSGAFTADMLRRAEGTTQVDVREPFAGTGRVVMTASTSLQFAHEGERDVRASRSAAQPSVFTSAVVAGLRDGSADRDGDGLVSVTDLYDYVYDRVRQKVPAQTPTLSVASAQGEIYLTRNPGAVEGDLLAEMRGAVAEAQAWKRIGALHLLERLLGSVNEPTREAARAALLGLIADGDSEVAGRARQLWHTRGLGDLPGAARPGRPGRARKATVAKTAVGIDFGTTNSAVGLLVDGDVRLVPNAEGSLITPSVVSFTDDGKPLIGAAALRRATTHPAETIQSVKLRLGTDWHHEHNGIRYTAEEIAALILERLHADVREYTGKPIDLAIVTVPAYFERIQRQALADAARLAGIPVGRIISEPTAAAMTYGLNRADEETVLVFDLGGGTFDVSLLEIGDGICEVKATAGDNRLGGDDWDERLASHLAEVARHQYGLDVAADPAASRRLRAAAEQAKIDLSSAPTTQVTLPYLGTAHGQPVHLDLTLRRPEFEALTRATLERCRGPVNRVLADAEISADRLDHVILVGGASRMPAVGRFVAELTGKPPYRGIIPEGVVTGAALQAGILTGLVKDMLLLDVIPVSVGIEQADGTFYTVIVRNSTIPILRPGLFTTTLDNQDRLAIRVLEGEAHRADRNKPLATLSLADLPRSPAGAPRIQVLFDIDANGLLHVTATDLGTGQEVSGVLDRGGAKEAAGGRGAHAAGRDLPVPVTDVPFALGLETADGRFHQVIPAGAAVPASGTVTVTNTDKGQRVVAIQVVEDSGRHTTAARYWRLRHLELSVVAPAARRKARIEIKLEVSKLWNLTVTARELPGGAETSQSESLDRVRRAPIALGAANPLPNLPSPL